MIGLGKAHANLICQLGLLGVQGCKVLQPYSCEAPKQGSIGARREAHVQSRCVQGAQADAQESGSGANAGRPTEPCKMRFIPASYNKAVRR